MNNQITLAYLDYDDLDALQVVSVVSFYESFIDGADPLDMQGYLQTQLTTEILAVELAQSTSKFIGIKDHQILIGYMKVNDEKDDGRNMTEISELLNDAIISIRDTKEESDIDSLFSGGGTSALMSNISGLDDFELICFLVVK